MHAASGEMLWEGRGGERTNPVGLSKKKAGRRRPENVQRGGGGGWRAVTTTCSSVDYACREAWLS